MPLLETEVRESFNRQSIKVTLFFGYEVVVAALSAETTPAEDEVAFGPGVGRARLACLILSINLDLSVFASLPVHHFYLNRGSSADRCNPK